ncbi:hypothetical protein GEV33_006817 [Tenebrio molitor]|uniref:Uncharacterized protein n=1 Tax=Tenebrio molitor TaxID=7067 RepID=A0A8J6HJW4_TENMO|nr:hypothetical protein GEV33_006817 [Tenebrio molitor]
MSDIVIGIDLGTTNTCTAYYFNSRVKILENEEGGRVTPSHLHIDEKNTVVVGHYARRMSDLQPECAIYELKRLIGRKFDDPYVQNNLQYFSFGVENCYNKPIVTIQGRHNKLQKTPVELCAAILSKMKRDATSKVREPVDKAVITVPAYFNISQRQATLKAANKAGFTVLKLLNEPTAAALSYYLENDCEEEHLSLVYDLGGGTFDVAILKRNGSNIDIIGVAGDTHLGGHDFDNLIADYVCAFLERNYNYNPKSERRNMRRLRNECEEAKKILSMTESTSIVLNGFVPNHPTVEIDLSRKQFEEMSYTLLKRTITIMDDCLKSCKIDKTDIQEVILSGGSTRVPKIQEMISSYFDGKSLNKFVNPDECVAEGAALQAAMFSIHPKQKIDIMQIKDVTPLSLGISNFVDLMTFFIKKNTTIPVSRTLNRVTVDNLQKSMAFNIYEGERMNCKKNHHLAKVVIDDITPAPPGQCEAIVTMSIDENGILKVTAKEEHRNNVKNLTIEYTRGHRSDKEVTKALEEAEIYKLEDEYFVQFASLKEYVLDYCERAKYNFEEKGLTESHKSLYELCKETKEATEYLNLEDKDKLEDFLAKIESKCKKRYIPVLHVLIAPITAPVHSLGCTARRKSPQKKTANASA